MLCDFTYKHGKCKLQCGVPSLLCLTSHDGGSLVVQSATTGEYIPIKLGPEGLNQECFNNTAVVDEQENKSLVPNTLYSVFVRNLDGTEEGNRLEFITSCQGFNPLIIESNGFYVANTGGPNIGLMYVGQVFSGNSDMSSHMAPSKYLTCPVSSHFNEWNFGFQSTPIIKSNFTPANNGLQTDPTILFVTEGISSCPTIQATLDFLPLVDNTTFEFCIHVSGQTITGSWVTTSIVRYCTGKFGNWTNIDALWQSAPPVGVYTAKLVINCLSGRADIRSSMLGNIGY